MNLPANEDSRSRLKGAAPWHVHARAWPTFGGQIDRTGSKRRVTRPVMALQLRVDEQACGLPTGEVLRLAVVSCYVLEFVHVADAARWILAVDGLTVYRHARAVQETPDRRIRR